MAAAIAPDCRAQTRWGSFTAILWHSELTQAALAALPRLGITAGRVQGLREHFSAATLRSRLRPLRQAGLHVMIENVATDFYAAYHRWQPGRAVNAAFQKVQQRYRSNPADPAIWRRQPGLNDPVAFAAIARRLAAHAAALRAQPALYICLGDETGIADLSAAWDFDESPTALQVWRGWLQRRYGRLARLNRAWQTHYLSWTALRPTRTNQALDGSGPIASWMEFKAWMDIDFAAAIRRGAQVVHRADPHARVGIEGVQLPGWGGYNYATLAPSVDVMEVAPGYPAALARAFNRKLVMLVTSSAADVAEAHRLWRFLLQGGRGVVLWDPDRQIVRRDGLPGPRGRPLASILQDLRGSLGRRLLAAQPVQDPVGVVYSQSSFRLRWLLDRRAERARGMDWTQRSNDIDLADSPWRTAIAAAADSLNHLGINPTWIDEAALTPARLARLHAVLLPQALALDPRALATLRGFAAGGGLVLADAEPGQYDTLGHLRPAAPLAGLVRLLPSFALADLRAVLPAKGRVMAPTGAPRDDVSIFRYDGGRLVAIQRDSFGVAQTAVLVMPSGRYPIRLDPVHPTVVVPGPRKQLSAEVVLK